MPGASRPDKDPAHAGREQPSREEPERLTRAHAPSHAPAPPAGSGELVAHADRALAALDGSGELEKKLREAARVLLRGVNAASAAGFLAAAALVRDHAARESES